MLKAKLMPKTMLKAKIMAKIMTKCFFTRPFPKTIVRTQSGSSLQQNASNRRIFLPIRGKHAQLRCMLGMFFDMFRKQCGMACGMFLRPNGKAGLPTGKGPSTAVVEPDLGEAEMGAGADLLFGHPADGLPNCGAPTGTDEIVPQARTSYAVNAQIRTSWPSSMWVPTASSRR